MNGFGPTVDTLRAYTHATHCFWLPVLLVGYSAPSLSSDLGGLVKQWCLFSLLSAQSQFAAIMAVKCGGPASESHCEGNAHRNCPLGCYISLTSQYCPSPRSETHATMRKLDVLGFFPLLSRRLHTYAGTLLQVHCNWKRKFVSPADRPVSALQSGAVLFFSLRLTSSSSSSSSLHALFPNLWTLHTGQQQEARTQRSNKSINGESVTAEDWLSLVLGPRTRRPVAVQDSQCKEQEKRSEGNQAKRPFSCRAVNSL